MVQTDVLNNILTNRISLYQKFIITEGCYISKSPLDCWLIKLGSSNILRISASLYQNIHNSRKHLTIQISTVKLIDRFGFFLPQVLKSSISVIIRESADEDCSALVLGNAMLCVAELISGLGAHAIASLTSLMPTLVTVATNLREQKSQDKRLVGSRGKIQTKKVRQTYTQTHSHT